MGTRRKSKKRTSLLRNRTPVLSAAAVVLALVAVGMGVLLHPFSHAATLVDLPDFRMECNVDHFAMDDPIVYPGQPGASHMHSFYSNKSTNAFSTPSSLAGSAGSCAYTGDFDRSAYWVPSVFYTNPDGTTSMLTDNRQEMIVYYRRAGGTTGPLVHPFPVGLRMIAGDSKATAPQSASITSWDCGDGGPSYPSIPDCTNAQSGNTPVGFVNFPNCWNGVDLDSPDHKSHMAYSDPNTGACPADHPVSLPKVSFEDNLNGTSGGPNYFLSSGDGKYTMHGDFYAAWDPRLQAGLVDTCMNTTQFNCSVVQVDNNGAVTHNGTYLFNINDPKYAAAPTPTPSGPPVTAKQGDINGDGLVNVFDLSILLSSWNTRTTGPADLDHNGVVNVFDLSILLSHWGT